MFISVDKNHPQGYQAGPQKHRNGPNQVLQGPQKAFGPHNQLGGLEEGKDGPLNGLQGGDGLEDEDGLISLDGLLEEGGGGPEGVEPSSSSYRIRYSPNDSQGEHISHIFKLKKARNWYLLCFDNG